MTGDSRAAARNRRWTTWGAVGAIGASVALLGATITQAGEAPAEGDAVARLQGRLDRHEAKLDYAEGGAGYLPSLLKQLDIGADSQLLVFSKTSLQSPYIGPRTPRSIYFNDSVSIGGNRASPLIELTADDPGQGLKFYVLDARKTDSPRFQEEGADCLACHGTVDPWASAMMVSSVAPLSDGSVTFPIVGALFDITDARTPFADRWGGWYVTGTHGAMAHKGNVMTDDPSSRIRLPPQMSQNVTDLSDRFDVSQYLEPTSDIVALMTLEHQVGFTNLVNRINGQVAYLGSPGEAPTTWRPKPQDVDASVEALAAYMLGVDAAPLTATVKGVSTFTETFQQRGPRDAKGRSLRDFDLKTRLFRYPVSFMIYTPVFDGLAPAAKDKLYHRLADVLTGADRSGKFASLSAADRLAALEILIATKPDLPAWWPRTVAVAKGPG